MYWLVAICFKIFGFHDAAARLPIAIASIALMLVTASFSRWAFGGQAGLYSGLIIGTCAGIYLFTRILIPDVMVALWLTSGLYCFLRALDRIERGSEPRNWLIGLYGSAALAVLTKGLIGMVFPGAIIGLFLLVTRKLYLIPKFWLITGTIFFLIIAAPWHLLAGFQNVNPNGHGFFWFYFINEHFLRYLGKRYPVDYDKVPIVLFYVLHFVWLFPWSIFAPLYRFSGDWTTQYQSDTKSREINLLLLIWPAIIILFFSFSTRQEYYTLPALPAFAILLGRAIAAAESSNANFSLQRWLSRLRFSLFIFGIFSVIASAIILYLTRNTVAQSDISTMLGRNPEYYALSLGHIFDLQTSSFAALRVPLIGASLSFFIGGTACYFLGRQNKHLLANLAIALMMAVFFIFSQMAMWVFNPYLSSQDIAKVIKQTYQNGNLIVINGEYESGASINFYTQEPILMLNNRTANLEFGSNFPDAPKRFLDNTELLQYWDSNQKIYLVTPNETSSQLINLLGTRKVYEIANIGGKYLYSNKPLNPSKLPS